MSRKKEQKISGAVMVIGGGIAGMQASLDLANSGYYVYLVEKGSAIGGLMARLDKTFPTNDCTMWVISPKLVEVGQHLNIEILTDTELITLDGEPGNFNANIRSRPRYVDISKCTSCGECAKVCPISRPNEYNCGLSMRKAAYKKYDQAIPGAFAIDKKGVSPCKSACPAHVSVQGFIALTAEGRYAEALKLFKQNHPFPGICGRVCHHPCEASCTRNNIDAPLSIKYIHRFLADTDMKAEKSYLPEIKDSKTEKIAVIGAGPAGLTCAYYLAVEGYQVTVFEKLPVLGGMLSVGIPAYRLPRDIIEAEIQTIKDLGVDFKTGVEIGKDITIDQLRKEGYDAFFVGIGAHGYRKLHVEGEQNEGVISGIEFLKDTALGKKVELGKQIIVIGGGNVAMDVAITAKKLYGGEVTIVCIESSEEMPAFKEEIEEALEEDIKIINSFGVKEIKGENNRVTGIDLQRCIRVFDEEGRFNPAYDPADIQTLSADAVIAAIGQASEWICIDAENGCSLSNRGTLNVNPLTLQTDQADIFAGGDAVLGPRTVVEAIYQGKEAAVSIDRFIRKIDLTEEREKNFDPVENVDITDCKEIARQEMPSLLPEERIGNFSEVQLGFDETQALKEAERCISCGVCSECYQCVEACLAGAIEHDQTLTEKSLDVGAVILASGCEPFDPSELRGIYQYKNNPNVLTSLEFERILSASGPTMGHLQRPSDGKEPKKIAWLQCIGSRDINKSGNGYCSSVCCMYAVKDAMIAKEHSKEDIECAIFNMDIRTFGKDYEKYYIRARDKEGVRFEKARVHSITEDTKTGDLICRYFDDTGKMSEESFDMVVLSVGLTVTKSAADMAKRLDVRLNRYNFTDTNPFMPIETSREGIFTCGVFQGPKDIPETVTQGSAAACAASSILAESRGTEIKKIDIPEEINVENLEPRIGVFVCNCGINIAGVVNVDEVEKYAATLPNVVYTGQNLFTCSQDALEQMTKTIKENELNRVVVASCTPKTHETLFMSIMELCGLNRHLFEMANIRNQNSWIHSDNPEGATQKAKDLIRMAVARSATLKSLTGRIISVVKRALVIGGGIAGMNAALDIARQGFEVFLVEKEKTLGGMALNLHHTIEGSDIKAYLRDLIDQVNQEDKIEVLLNAEISKFGGYKGNFNTEVLVGGDNGEKIDISHGVGIVATGAKEYRPSEYSYGEDERILTQIELSDLLEKKGGVSEHSTVVMIQCVGSRNDEFQECSRICCQGAIKNALNIKKSDPDTNVIILYRDIRTYGLLEDYYKEARERGVLFIRFEKDTPPDVKISQESIDITVTDHILRQKIEINADLLALSAGMRPNDPADLREIMKLNCNNEGYLIEAHVKLRPVDMPTEGMYLCGTAHGPKLITETISQARAAVSRAMTILTQSSLKLSAVTAKVNSEHCVKCLTCVRACPFGVPVFDEKEQEIKIDDALCRGCGVCTAVCPRQTIQLGFYEDNQLNSKIDALFAGGV